eukprot:3639850-Prymnesium_polylepis.1
MPPASSRCVTPRDDRTFLPCGPVPSRGPRPLELPSDGPSACVEPPEPWKSFFAAGFVSSCFLPPFDFL